MNALLLRKKSGETWILILCLLVSLHALREYYFFEFRRHVMRPDSRLEQFRKAEPRPKEYNHNASHTQQHSLKKQSAVPHQK